MKIRSLLAVAILGCLAAGFILEFSLAHQFSKVHDAANKARNLTLWTSKLDRVSGDIRQLLISTELILGNDESYLVEGATRKADLISESLSALGNDANTPQDLTDIVQNLAPNLHSISRLLARATQLGSDNRENKLDELLRQTDQHGATLLTKLESLTERARLTSSNFEADAISATKEAQLVRVLAMILFSVIVLCLWFWANRQISNPIYSLIDHAKDAENTGHFKELTRGSAEVIELASHAARLTNTLSYQATHDPLTNLINRRQFDRILNHSEKLARDYELKDTHVLCFIDLDHFKIVNDTCGHAAGDELLIQVSVLLSNHVRKVDTVARLGGDEFALFLNCCDIATATEICNKIRNSIREIRYEWDQDVYRISASIGVTEIDFSNDSIESTVNAADTACKVAKDSGRDRVHVFAMNDQMLAHKRHEMLYINQINTAVEESRFELHRQFITPLQADPLAGNHFEILVRMLSQDGGLIFPNDFLPVVERYQLGSKLDRWIIGATIDWLIARPEEMDALRTCAINLSGQSLASQDLKDYIEQRLAETNFPAEKLCFEITETAAITDIEYAKQFISDLRKLGCRFALDDFGSGLSSFAYLQSLDVDVIKIDGSFVRDMTGDKVNYATVKSINEVAKAVGKITVAEFVENAEIAEALAKLGVDYAQGYHFSKPERLPQNSELEKKLTG
ncbi:MAG: putative bifunctional diguanylate cyclase/phosphodiesterase [Pseudomonadales bacterium]